MKYFILISFVLINFSFSIAQDVIVKSNDSNGKAALFSLSGEKSALIDSISINKNAYQYNFKNKHTGFYRIAFNNKKSLNFIYDNNDSEIDYTDDTIGPRVIQSDDNKTYYDFIEINKDYKTKTELLFLILSRYPDNDEYLITTKETLLKLQEEYLYFINVTAQSKPKSFIARYIGSAQLPVIDMEVSTAHHIKFLKTHSLDKVNFNDDALIYSDVFTNKSIEYLSYYRNPQLPMELLEKEFEAAIDSILNKAKVNGIVYKHIVEYLLEGFKKFGFDNVINYIIDSYVIADNICLDEKLESALERRINQNKIFNPGYVVPDISLADILDKKVMLGEIKTEKTLILFYASWCPHCKTMLPEIYDLYINQKVKNTEVLAVSIDSSKTDWQSFVTANDLNWINVCDTNSWNGKAATDYYIYATPTMFLVDKNKKLISVPLNIEALKQYFN